MVSVVLGREILFLFLVARGNAMMLALSMGVSSFRLRHQLADVLTITISNRVFLDDER
jgi:hypothetical protein